MPFLLFVTTPTTQAARDRATRADAHQLIADAGAKGMTCAQLQSRGIAQAFWAVEQLKSRGMIKHLPGVPGGCCDLVYVTIRNAR